MIRIAYAAVFCLICGLFAFQAKAQQIQCFPYNNLVQRLIAIGESLVSAGVDERGNLVQVYSSAAGAWTLFVRLERNGVVYACPVSSGDGWQQVEPKRGKPS